MPLQRAVLEKGNFGRVPKLYASHQTSASLEFGTLALSIRDFVIVYFERKNLVLEVLAISFQIRPTVRRTLYPYGVQSRRASENAPISPALVLTMCRSYMCVAQRQQTTVICYMRRQLCACFRVHMRA